MDSYNFTFKDVLKRHERMINRVEKWEIHVLAIIMLVVTLFFVLTSGVFASTEVFPISHNNWGISATKLVNSENRDFYQYLVTPGNQYTFYASGGTPQIVVRGNDGDVLSLGDVVTNIVVFNNLNEVTITIPDDVNVVGLCCELGNEVHLYNDSSSGYENSVSGLVNDVGINQIWDVFGSGVDFIYVVVIVALGIFLIALAIRKISKGKSEF